MTITPCVDRDECETRNDACLYDMLDLCIN